MNDITVHSTLAEVVTALPSAARVLESFGLDYCCGGARELGPACRAADVDPAVVLDKLGDLGADPDADWPTMAPAELVAHLLATHHAYLHTELPRLSALAEKVASVHGDRHPELQQVQAAFESLRAGLEPHLMKEEQILFPMITELAGPGTAPAHCGTVGSPIAVMRSEHDRDGELLAELRRITDDYRAPGDGCASYRAFYDGLAQLEADTHLHIHKENNLLFPAAVELEAATT